MTEREILERLYAWAGEVEEKAEAKELAQDDPHMEKYETGKNNGISQFAFRVRRFIESHQDPDNPVVPRNEDIEGDHYEVPVQSS